VNAKIWFLFFSYNYVLWWGTIANGYYLLEYFEILSKLKFTSITVTLDVESETHNKRRCLDDVSPTYDEILLGMDKYLGNGMPI